VADVAGVAVGEEDGEAGAWVGEPPGVDPDPVPVARKTSSKARPKSAGVASRRRDGKYMKLVSKGTTVTSGGRAASDPVGR
jgi:hypothetical protein